MPRDSINVSARNASAGIKAAQGARGFTPAPGAKKGKGGQKGDYGQGNLQAARSGPLSDKMAKVFARDSRLDPGTEEVTRVVSPGRESGKVAARDAYVKEARSIARRDPEVKALQAKGFNVIVTKEGGVQARHTKGTGGHPGTVAHNLRPAFKGEGGRFSAPAEPVTEKRVVVVDKDSFRDAAERRVEAYGASLFGSVSPARKAAMLAGLERDRKSRGWDGVPDL